MWSPMEGAPLMDYSKKYYTTGPEGLIEYHETELEDALELAGVGKYQTIHCFLMVATLSAALLEITGPAYIVPAAACDLNIPDGMMGILSSIPNLGIIITAPLWGRFADAWGRKPVLLLSSAVTGIFSFSSAFSKSLSSYIICRSIASLFLSCPTSLGWVYMSEMLPKRRRDSTVLVCNAFFIMSTILSPVIAWLIFSNQLHSVDGIQLIKPWRLLGATYALILLLIVLCMARLDESPKYLMSRGLNRSALQVVKHIYSVNSGQAPERFSVTSLTHDNCEQRHNAITKMRQGSALALVQPPHFKRLALLGFLMFGLFTVLNGLFLFTPTIVNKVMNTPLSLKGTICMLVDKPLETSFNPPICNDTMSRETFIILVFSTLVYSLVAMAASMSSIDKRIQLITMFTIVGMACLCCGMQSNRLMAAFAMLALQLPSLGVGALSAYTVHLFPTSLRGTAVGAVLMCGRLGSVVGANVTGHFLSLACSKTFYGFAILFLLCAGLTTQLPKHQSQSNLPPHT